MINKKIKYNYIIIILALIGFMITGLLLEILGLRSNHLIDKSASLGLIIGVCIMIIVITCDNIVKIKERLNNEN